MIKEFWILVKMLFASKPKDIELVKIVDMKHFPFKGFKFLMWCGYMIYRLDNEDNIGKEMLTNRFEISKTHETIHLAQAKLCGSWWKYYMRYLWEWLKGNPVLHPSSSAYMTIPFECEAYGNEDNPDYAKNYDGSNIGKYTFKKRKKLYKSVGGTFRQWKIYLKSLR